MSNECLPRDVEETEMLKNNNFDQGVMVDVVHLLRVWLLLHKLIHLINVSKQKVWEVKHFHPCKVHEELDVVGVQPGKYALASEIFDDDSHQGDILFSRNLKGKSLFT